MPAILQVAAAAPHHSRPIPYLVPDYRRDVHEQLSTASAVTRRPRPFRPVPRGPASSGGKSEGNPLGSGHGWTGPRSIASAVRLASDIAPRRPSSALCDRRRKAATQAETSRGVGQIGGGDSLAQGP